MEVITSNKGGQKICHNGHMYVRKITKNNWIRWQCSRQSSLKCRGALTTDHNFENLRSFVEHNHEADETKVAVTKLRTLLKQQARETKGLPHQLLAKGLESTSVEVRANIGRLETCRRDLRRQKRGTLPTDPLNLHELVITDDWISTSSKPPQRFLLHDTGPDACNRVVVYASDECLRLLGRASTWFMDGNLNMAPRIFQQLYVIKVPFGETMASCVYAFLPEKTQSIYEELLQSIIDGCEMQGFVPDPIRIVIDYDIAAMQAVVNVLGPHVTTQGCFYHLTQNIWNKVQDFGLSNYYLENDDCKLFCGMISGLALLPPGRVEEGMVFLKENVPEKLQDFLSNFDRTYVTGTFRQIRPLAAEGSVESPPVRVRRLPPVFPPATWNAHAATLSGDNDRINNLCESWSTSFKQLFGNSRPSFCAAVEKIRKEEAHVNALILQEDKGKPPFKKVKITDPHLQQRLKNLCEDLIAGRKTIEEFLRAVGHCVCY